MPDETKPVDEATMLKWNAFQKYVKDQGYAGDPKLDHDPKLRQKVFDGFNALNPNTPMSQDVVMDVQGAMQDYKQNVIAAMKSGKVTFDNGVNEKNFMSNISKVDGVYGQYTSQWSFPLAKAVVNGQSSVLGLAAHHDVLKEINNLPTQ